MRIRDMAPEQRKLHNRKLREARKAKAEEDEARIYRMTGGGPVGMMIGSLRTTPAGGAKKSGEDPE